MVVTWDVAAANNSKRFAFKGILSVLGLAIAFGPGGNASRAAGATASGTELTEVVVTAQKREQNLQEVPIAVIALWRRVMVAPDAPSCTRTPTSWPAASI